MTPLAHVGALPVEELATWLLTGGVTVIGAACAVVRRPRGGHRDRRRRGRGRDDA